MNNVNKIMEVIFIVTCSADIIVRAAYMVSDYRKRHKEPEIPDFNMTISMEDDEWDIK